MKLSDRIRRGMARIYLRYVSVVFCLAAGVALFLKPPRESAGKRLLVLKPDAVGDYILFRNFMKLLRAGEKYRDYEIVFCGNSACRDFALHYDSAYADEFVWIDKNRIYLDIFYYIRFARSMYRRFSVTIQPVRSRELLFDFIVRISGSGERIAPEGDTVNILHGYKKMSDRWYTRLIPSGDQFSFEFDANRQFFELLLDQPVLFRRPFLEKDHRDDTGIPGLPQRFIALFPGAQLPFRRWKTRNFAAVCRDLGEKYGMDTVILGSGSDRELAGEIVRFSGGRLMDLTGRTRLHQLPEIIARSRMVITNDSMAAHLGAALDIPTVVISQMNHYGRFVPYPEELKVKMICVIPESFQRTGSHELTEKFRYGSEVDINLITVNQVSNAIAELHLIH